MKYIQIDHVGNDQIMLIQDELSGLYYTAVEGSQNYSFTPDYVSKSFKTKVACLKHFNKVLQVYKEKVLNK